MVAASWGCLPELLQCHFTACCLTALEPHPPSAGQALHGIKELSFSR